MEGDVQGEVYVRYGCVGGRLWGEWNVCGMCRGGGEMWGSRCGDIQCEVYVWWEDVQGRWI